MVAPNVPRKMQVRATRAFPEACCVGEIVYTSAMHSMEIDVTANPPSRIGRRPNLRARNKPMKEVATFTVCNIIEFVNGVPVPAMVKKKVASADA